MGYLSAKIRNRIKAKIALKESQLAAANAAYLQALGSADVESYKFDSREGKQETTLRSPSVILKQIEMLESDLDRLYRRLEGGGIISFNLRRR